MIAELTVAKKKAPKVEPSPSEDEMRDELIAVRCTARYKKWVQGFAKAELITPTQLVAIALKKLAEDRKYEAAPDR